MIAGQPARTIRRSVCNAKRRNFRFAKIQPEMAGDFRLAKGGLWYGPDMNREAIIARLRECETELKAHGVTHAALFGSAARNEQGPDSDIDILVDLDPEVVATMFDYAGLKAYVASLFQGSVDVIDREALKPRLRPHVTADAIYAF